MKKMLLLTATMIALTACSSERVSHFPSYKLQVVQGNQLDPQAILALENGMTRDQVQLLLGTPLLRDPFHANRWDYSYETARNGVLNKDNSRNLIIFFEGDQVVKFEGNALDYAREQAVSQSPSPASETEMKKAE